MKTYFALRPLSSLLFLTLGLTGFAYAEKADQDKPIILEAEKVSVNDVMPALSASSICKCLTNYAAGKLSMTM